VISYEKWFAALDQRCGRLGSGTSMHHWRDVAVNETSVALEHLGDLDGAAPIATEGVIFWRRKTKSRICLIICIWFLTCLTHFFGCGKMASDTVIGVFLTRALSGDNV